MARSKVPFIREMGEESEYHSRNVRKIDNGYLTVETYNKGGIYKSSEKFSENHPDEGEKRAANNGSLALAVNKLKGR